MIERKITEKNGIAWKSDRDIATVFDNYVDQYDSDLKKWLYNAPAKVAKRLAARLPLYSHILDVGCGTGLVGVELRKVGFSFIDGIDISSLSLRVAWDKFVYHNLCCMDLHDELPSIDETIHVEEDEVWGGPISNRRDEAVEEWGGEGLHTGYKYEGKTIKLYPSNSYEWFKLDVEVPIAFHIPYDGITCVGVLTYLKDIPDVLTRLIKLVRTGGAVELTQRSDMYKYHGLYKDLKAMVDTGLISNLEITDPEPYLPKYEVYGEEVLVHYINFTVL